MPNLPLFKQTLKRTIADNIGQCIKQLEASLDPAREAYNICLAQLAAFNRIEREHLNNLISREDYNRELSKSGMALMQLIDSLSEEDLSEVRHLREEIHERLLVITRPGRREYMERFFSGNFFKNIHYICYGDPVPPGRFDLALLEDIEPEPLSAMLMGQYIDDVPCYCLYFGEKFQGDRVKYADKLYYANSIFSLYARIKEMLDFIKYYDGDALPG